MSLPAILRGSFVPLSSQCCSSCCNIRFFPLIPSSVTARRIRSSFRPSDISRLVFHGKRGVVCRVTETETEPESNNDKEKGAHEDEEMADSAESISPVIDQNKDQFGAEMLDSINPINVNGADTKAQGGAEEYGGDDGWPFIEADAYKLLIDTILDVQEEGDEGEKCNEEDAGAGPSVVVHPPISSEVEDAATQTLETEGSNLLRPGEGDEEGWKDIDLPQNCDDKDVVDDDSGQGKQLDSTPLHSPPSTAPSPQPVNSPPIRRRKPCHGWISSEEEEDDFIELIPAIRLKPAKPPVQPENRTTPAIRPKPAQPSGQPENRTGGNEEWRKRKTRWDVGPECT